MTCFGQVLTPKETHVKLKKITAVAAGFLLASGINVAMAASGTIKIGVQAPLTGTYAAEGQGINNGVRLLVNQQNAKGGLLGHKIEVVTCDDMGILPQAGICARKLVNKGVLAVIGSYTSGAALAAGTTYARANVIQTSDGTSNKLTHSGWKTFFRNAPPNSTEAAFTADYLVNVKGYKRIAVLTDRSSFATGLAKSVTNAIQQEGGDIVVKSYLHSGKQDYTTLLNDIKSHTPDVIYFSGYYSEGGLIKAQMAKLHINAAFVGGDANQNDAFAKIAGNAAAGAIIINLPSPESLPYASAKKFLADYSKAYDSMPPSIFTLTNVDGLGAIFAAIKATQSIDPDTLMHWMHNMPQKFAGMTGSFTWSNTGERLGSPMTAFEVQADGSYKTVYPVPAS